MKKNFLTTLCIIMISLVSYGQEENEQLRNIFLDGEFFYAMEAYEDALLEYQKLYKRGFSDNANINYRIGTCYLNIAGEKEKSIEYLEKAVKDVTPDYNDGSFKEKEAPWDAWIFLGNAYRIAERLDDAINAYYQYIETASGTKLSVNIPYVKKEIQACKYAKSALRRPGNVDYRLIDRPISTNNNDFKAVISADGKALAYMSTLPFYDAVFYSTYSNGRWSRPRNITPEIQSDGDQYICALSSDGSQMLLTREDEFVSNVLISELDPESGKWSKSDEINNINSKFWESNASFAPNDSIIYFASNRNGGFGEMDLYRSKLSKSGDWGPAENLGPIVNTVHNEDAPFVTRDGKTLFFSSQGQVENIGGYDVFYSKLRDDGKWGAPETFGYPFNTTDDEIFYQPKTDSTGIQCLMKKNGVGEKDVYEITIMPFVEEAEPLAEKYETPVAERTGEETGEVVVETPPTPESMDRIEINPVYFDFNSAELTANAKDKLDNLTSSFNEHQFLKVQVIGYTDGKGSELYNYELSKRRAKAVIDYMINKGIKDQRLVMLIGGSNNPIAKETGADGKDNPEARKYNRRAEFRLMNVEGKLNVIYTNEVPEKFIIE